MCCTPAPFKDFQGGRVYSGALSGLQKLKRLDNQYVVSTEGVSLLEGQLRPQWCAECDGRCR